MNLRVPRRDVLECQRPKRVFPYHIWLPYGKYTHYFEVKQQLDATNCCALQSKLIQSIEQLNIDEQFFI